MSSNLPPGVTDADIERHALEDSLLERFERALNKQKEGKSPEEHQALDIIYNEPLEMRQGTIRYLAEFVERAMHWAYEEGVKEVERR